MAVSVIEFKKTLVLQEGGSREFHADSALIIKPGDGTTRRGLSGLSGVRIRDRFVGLLPGLGPSMDKGELRRMIEEVGIERVTRY